MQGYLQMTSELHEQRTEIGALAAANELAARWQQDLVGRVLLARAGRCLIIAVCVLDHDNPTSQEFTKEFEHSVMEAKVMEEERTEYPLSSIESSLDLPEQGIPFVDHARTRQCLGQAWI